ncbi:YdeI/OmpD-associated family protein [Sinanaerobacter chloroacetimidivorans]|uniref:DUF1905 domain-containing protein n=1 Tax=Sinanaerobacter chloroacetimidivorans TaxID=2818044 RepID=A0A8J7W3Z2_9FIRM|nr:YdeI/OmpD-associated family protein [Sinanaerobacter chloroacetimidivorans]MBR0598713.1 DUF1905 domain-containing protein [Sinanaerobacter chloroacetimidivorans]
MKQEFTAVIKQHEGINGAYVEIPFDVPAVFGAKRVKVIATFDGYEYQGSIVSMGGCFLIGMTQQIRKEINKTFGNEVFVTIEKDESERKADLPEDFRSELLKNSGAFEFWTTLSFSNQRKYTDWITSAKKVETRLSRIEKAISMLSEREVR